jgi:transcriptional regulator with XRE-family HTH domain
MGKTQDIFIENLKKIRNKKGLTQAQLAEKADLSSGLIGDIETGKSNPTLTTIEKISVALECPAHLLLFDYRSSYPETDESNKALFREELFSLIDNYWKIKFNK